MSSVALLGSALLINQTVYAAILLDNITGTTQYNSTGTAIQQYRSCGFMMSTQEYRLTNIQVALRYGSGTAASSQNTFEIRSGTTTPSTTVVATLNPSPINGTGYTTTAQLVTLTPATTVMLQPSTTYWVVMVIGNMTNYLMWPQNNLPTSNAAPTSSVGVMFYGCLNSSDNATWGSSGVKNSFQINGEIPLPPVAAPIVPKMNKQVETFATEIELK